MKYSINNLRERANKNLGTFSSHHIGTEAENIFHHNSAINAIDDNAYPEVTYAKNACKKFIFDLL